MAFLIVFAAIAEFAAAIQCQGLQDYRRHDRISDKGFGRPERTRVHPFSAPPPALPVQMKIVPYHAQVEIEDVPAYARSTLGHNCRGISYECASVNRIGFQTGAATLGYSMRLITCMVPGNGCAYSYRYIVEFKAG